jgi:hypothetical protein
MAWQASARQIFLPVIVVKGDDAIDIRARDVQSHRDQPHRGFRDKTERGLQIMQNRQHRAFPAVMRGDYLLCLGVVPRAYRHLIPFLPRFRFGTYHAGKQYQNSVLR